MSDKRDFLFSKVSKGSKVGSMPGDQAPCTRDQAGGHEVRKQSCYSKLPWVWSPGVWAFPQLQGRRATPATVGSSFFILLSLKRKGVLQGGIARSCQGFSICFSQSLHPSGSSYACIHFVTYNVTDCIVGENASTESLHLSRKAVTSDHPEVLKYRLTRGSRYHCTLGCN